MNLPGKEIQLKLVFANASNSAPRKWWTMVKTNEHTFLGVK